MYVQVRVQLELQAVVSCHVDARVEWGSSVRAVSTLNLSSPNHVSLTMVFLHRTTE